MIKYRDNHKKTLEGLVWFAKNAPDLDHYWAVKTLFFADYYHLNRHGRPVFGDTIRALPWGPVPSVALDLINRAASFLPPEEVSAACEAFDVIASETGQRLAAKRDPDLDSFSRTDLECLRQALEYCRVRTFGELVQATHDLRSYKEARAQAGCGGAPTMDFELLLVDSPHREEMVEYLRETAPGAVF